MAPVFPDNLDNMHVSPAPQDRVCLTNDGFLSLFFIGTGAAFAKTLNQTNILVIKGNQHLLIDCGTKCSQALYQLGMGIEQVDNFLITHSHADHVGGLEEVQLHRRYVVGNKPKMIITETYQDILWNQSHRVGSERSESQELSFEDFWQVLRPTKLENQLRETWHAELGLLDIKLPRTMHFPDDASSWQDSQWSTGVILDDRVLFTSDTRYDPDLLISLDKHYDFDVIFHDCQLFTGGVHASLDELAGLPANIKERIVLMHYSDDWQDHCETARSYGFKTWAKESHLYTFPDGSARQSS
ncbi:MAG: MBL fold metallo-hydrolase [Pseudomonadales bacterium]|nr:MBL fold metallo-hydrolase [Pseudomonadales bacterium]